ncbi:CPBP family intramembrane glutamic endopeptidase [Jannaschia ovalis]|uniref:CPBP family intramembrane metalloprotease n=1 Tax=Jannaschia ovalis TaxID=3038773 RepID=A0ABY8LB20_9RHOB|nr:CPBP family intramembrane metalloprotease [Jannaschia sp. GRR-S6-38]WGH77240.1 CPBP family intramembrane metalloprotease [Jannaschia sp. GRR-S6-38]
MWTKRFEAFVAPARTKPQIWRLAAGLVLVVAVYAGCVVALLGLVWAIAGTEALQGWMQRIAQAGTPTAVLIMLASFIGMLIGPILAARWLHKRPGRTLLGPRLWAGFGLGAAITGLVFAANMLLIPAPFPLVPNTPLDLFLTFLPAALLGIALQTGAEEVLFRGYLQQQLAARFASPVVWMLLPSLAFGGLHYAPAMAGQNAWLLVAAATLFGLVAADLTRVTGSIGAAWGIHFVNNATAILFIALDGSLSGMSLFKTPFTAADTDILRPLIAQDMLVTVIIWACIRLWLARRDRTAPA